MPASLYDEVKHWLPIASVEAVIVIEGKLLFLRRTKSPAAGQWWFAGGRIHKGETLQQTLHREVKEETGLKISDSKLINVYSRIFPERHDITIAYLCHCKKDKIVLNDEHSEYQLTNTIPEGLHPYLLKTTEESGWNKNR